MLDKSEMFVIIIKSVAGVAHPVERHLAKVEVASSSLVTRSIKTVSIWKRSFLFLFRRASSPKKNNRPASSEAGLVFILFD